MNISRAACLLWLLTIFHKRRRCSIYSSGLEPGSAHPDGSKKEIRKRACIRRNVDLSKCAARSCNAERDGEQPGCKGPCFKRDRRC